MSTSVIIGDTVRLSFEIKSFDNLYTDPTELSVSVYAYEGRQIGDTVQLNGDNKLDVGKYFYDLIVPESPTDVIVVELVATLENSPLVSRTELQVSWI